MFDDFIAAAEWLIANKYTSTPKLAIGGGSNGGLLVGAVMTQRPDLFGAALPAVGVMDMLRFHKFTIGWAWKSDYGDPDIKDDFETALKYSPLHNLKPGSHIPRRWSPPATTTTAWCPRIRTSSSPTLQAAQGGSAPVLTRIETKAGHGAGKPTDEDHRGARGSMGVPHQSARHEMTSMSSIPKHRRHPQPALLNAAPFDAGRSLCLCRPPRIPGGDPPAPAWIEVTGPPGRVRVVTDSGDKAGRKVAIQIAQFDRAIQRRFAWIKPDDTPLTVFASADEVVVRSMAPDTTDVEKDNAFSTYLAGAMQARWARCGPICRRPPTRIAVRPGASTGAA